MKKQFKVGLLTAALVLSMGLSSMAATTTTNAVPAGYRVAIVDVPTVVAKSGQVKALKKEQEAKMAELQKWLESARADVDKQQTKEGKEKLVKKYDAEFAKKQEAIRKNYAEKLQAINNSISATIAAEAKAKNYDLVLPKGNVLFGGEDITTAVSKAVK